MKTTLLLSLAALGAQLAFAVPSASLAGPADAVPQPLEDLENFLGYYCSIPGKCTETAALAERSPSFHWGWNYCKLPGQPCSQKAKAKRDPAPSFHWGWNYCKLPGQPCSQKTKREVIEGFPGSEALDETATEEQKALADKYKEIAEKLFTSA